MISLICTVSGLCGVSGIGAKSPGIDSSFSPLFPVSRISYNELHGGRGWSVAASTQFPVGGCIVCKLSSVSYTAALHPGLRKVA